MEGAIELENLLDEEQAKKLFAEANEVVRSYRVKEKPERKREVFEELLREIRAMKEGVEYESWDQVEADAVRQGVPPLNFIVDIKRFVDYQAVAHIWSRIYGVPAVFEVRAVDVVEINPSVGVLRGGEVIVWYPPYALAIKEEAKKLERYGFRAVYLAPLPIFEGGVEAVSAVEQEFLNIINTARKLEATDIHFEVKQKGANIFVELKYRVLGDLRSTGRTYSLEEYSKLLHNIKNKIKDPPSFDAEEYYATQDGKILLPDKNLELRLAFTPAIDIQTRVQNLVIRVLSKDVLKIDRENPGRSFMNLGILEEDVDVILMQRHFTHGLVVTTGETGSGKSTFLNVFVSSMPSNLKILTAEDPVEYILENAVQHNVFYMEVGGKVYDVGFTAYIKEFMRMDPNVILLGEWRRDPELTEAMLYAVKTGHLVLTTLHASRVTVIPNLLENSYGVSRDDLASTVRFMMNQKLVKKVCPYCAREMEFREKHLLPVIDLPYRDIDDLRELVGKKVKVRNPDGCEMCIKRDSSGRVLSAGYVGRTLVYEFLYVDKEVQESILRDTSAVNMENLMLSKKKESFKGLRGRKARTYVDVIKSKVLRGEIDIYAMYHGLGYTGAEEEVEL